MNAVASAVAAAMQELGAGGIEDLAAALAGGSLRATVPAASTAAGFGTAAHRVLNAQLDDGASDVELVAYLRGVAAGYRQRTDALQVLAVWTGPSSHQGPRPAAIPRAAAATGEPHVSTPGARVQPTGMSKKGMRQLSRGPEVLT